MNEKSKVATIPLWKIWALLTIAFATVRILELLAMFAAS